MIGAELKTGIVEKWDVEAILAMPHIQTSYQNS
jgi:hypothetical protein